MDCSKKLLKYLDSKIFYIENSNNILNGIPCAPYISDKLIINSHSLFKRLSLAILFRFFYSKKFKMGNICIVKGCALFEGDKSGLFYAFSRDSQISIMDTPNFLIRDCESDYRFFRNNNIDNRFKSSCLFNFWDLLELLDIDLDYLNYGELK